MGAGLTLRALRSTAVLVPMARPLGTSAQTLRHAPLLLIDLETEQGVTGRAYLFCYLPAAAASIARMLDEAQRVIAGASVAPQEIGATLARHFRLLGVRGIVSMALAGIDMACWDALAHAAGLPMATLLGATPKPIPAYNSNGLGLMDAGAAADEAEALVAEGFAAIKMRLGRADEAADLAAVRAVRSRLADDIALMADYNQALSLNDAHRRCRALEGEGIYWIEEPIRHDDYAGNAALTRALDTPVQIGENFAGPQAMAVAIAAGAADFMMPDLERIGGVSGWQRAAALASVAGIELSSHLFPEVSAHLLAASPTAHWLEVVDWANPILAEPLKIIAGRAQPSTAPGSGLAWDDAAVARFRLD
ncbi:MAG: enolase C-terminal domain-like protein [Burkholderiaceae bacterium]